MTRNTISRSFKFLTPAFPHGVYQSQHHNRPELRAPSLRGQLRWWWRALSKSSSDPLGNKLFGNAAGSEGSSSLIQLRLHAPLEPSTISSEILPHKTDFKHRGPKAAYQPQVDEFTLELRPRRQGIEDSTHEKLTTVLDAWLLMGAVGQRANRAAGSPWPTAGAPISPAAYLEQCRRLLVDSDLRIALLNFHSDTPEALREIAGRFPNSGTCHIPGNVFGSARPRKPSPLRLRAVNLDGGLQLAALWAPLTPHEDTAENLKAGIAAMLQVEQKRELGLLLEEALPDLIS